MAEPIEMPFGRQTQVGARNHVLVLDGGGKYWCHLANSMKRLRLVNYNQTKVNSN